MTEERVPYLIASDRDIAWLVRELAKKDTMTGRCCLTLLIEAARRILTRRPGENEG